MRSKKLILLIPVCLGVFSLFQGILLNKAIIDIDYLFQQIPFRNFSHNEILSGRLPFVYPYSLSGIPLICHGQIGIFFPLTFITLLFKNQFLAYYLELVVLFLIGFTGEYLFSSLYLEDAEERIISALYFAFSPFIFVHIIHLNLIIPFMLLPYSLYVVRKIEDYKKLFALLTLIFMLSFLSFHPQAVMIHIVIVFVYSMFLKDTERLGWVFFSVFASILMSGIQILPFALLRFQGNFVDHKGLSWMTQGSFNPFISFPLFFIPLPYLRSPIQNTSTNGEIYLYITGFWGLFHYFLAKIWRRKGRELLFMTVLGLFFMIVMYNPLYIIVSKVPLLNTVRGHIRWWGGVLPFVSIMMAMGIRSSMKNGNSKKDVMILFTLPFIWLVYFIFVRLAAHEKWFYLFNIKERLNIAAFILWIILLLMLVIMNRKKKWTFAVFLSIEILLFANLLYPYARRSSIIKVVRSFKSYRHSRFVGVPLNIREIETLFMKEYNKDDILRKVVTFGTFFHGNFSCFLPAYNILGYVAPQLEPVYVKKTRNLIYQGFYLNKNPEKACEKLFTLDVNYLMSFVPLKDTSCLSFKEEKNGLFIYSVLDTEKITLFYGNGRYFLYNVSMPFTLQIPLRYIPGLYIIGDGKPLQFKVIDDVIRVYTNGSKNIVIGYKPLWIYYGAVMSIIGIALFIIIFIVRKKNA